MIGYPIESLFDQVAVITPTTYSTDASGGRVITAGTPVNEQCHIRALSGSEKEILGREGVLATHKVYLRGAAVIQESYLLTVAGVSYDISFVDNCHLLNHHIEVWVKRRK